LKCEIIRKIWQKIVKRYENTEENCEMIWKIWQKGKSKSEKNWKIWKKIGKR
jgi:hypothetical protein